MIEKVSGFYKGDSVRRGAVPRRHGRGPAPAAVQRGGPGRAAAARREVLGSVEFAMVLVQEKEVMWGAALLVKP